MPSQGLVVPALGVVPIVVASVEPVALPVVLPVPDAPMDVPLPEVLVSVEVPVPEPAVVLLDMEPEPVVELSVPAVAGAVVAGGVVVEVLDEVDVSAASRWPQADRDRAAIRARAAQRAMGVVIIRTLLEQL
jgi:hypothetical protein